MSRQKKTTRKYVKKTDPLKTVPPAETVAPSVPVSGATVPVVDSITEAERKKIEEAVLIAQLEFAKIKNAVVKEKRREIEALNIQIKEFMGPYMLIGYDLNNNPVEVFSAFSPADHDALLERLRRVVAKINQNIANSGGADPYGLDS